MKSGSIVSKIIKKQEKQGIAMILNDFLVKKQEKQGISTLFNDFLVKKQEKQGIATILKHGQNVVRSTLVWNENRRKLVGSSLRQNLMDVHANLLEQAKRNPA